MARHERRRPTRNLTYVNVFLRLRHTLASVVMRADINFAVHDGVIEFRERSAPGQRRHAQGEFRVPSRSSIGHGPRWLACRTTELSRPGRVLNGRGTARRDTQQPSSLALKETAREA
ncbi:hypothetical protein E2C01_036427 [Portunus trituberculatus]|uniref:Uncharacterized protein n=1 Tax=Portunus trituberculatus TaxID=210409 RepID=A0A5B7FBV5_PORTR|nr:hypothetical protein [Portunus trituberculatus]